MDTIVIITYKSGTREARFSTDPELLELIVDNFDYIQSLTRYSLLVSFPHQSHSHSHY